jgi:hypothetical protein
MHKRSFGAAQTQVAGEDAASRVFILWIAAWAVLTLSLFMFHGTGTHDASVDSGDRDIVRLAHVSDRSDANDTPVVSKLVGLY